jgi:hypothetical protein
MSVIPLLLLILLSPVQQGQPATVSITTSDAIDLARAIARDEGYDVTKNSIYSFELLAGKEGKPFLQDYTSIGFDINGRHRNLLVINNTTGQVADYNTCEIFDYPNVLKFQQRIQQLSKVQRKTPQELANDIGCGSPKVLNQPVKSGSSHTVSKAQAQELVLVSLSAGQKGLPGLSAEQYKDLHSSRFLFFTVTWAAKEGQSVVVGNFAVDPYTGDVWNAAASCDEMQDRALQRLQRRVRKSLDLSEAEYKRLKTRGPLCEQ